MPEPLTTTPVEVSEKPADTGHDSRNEDPVFRLASSDTAFCRLYEIGSWRRLGGGATACVVRLFNRLRHENVAVKIFVQPRGDIQLKIAAEVRITDKVVSANVVRVFGPHESDAFMWIEMEYVEGQTLKARLDDLGAAGKIMPIDEAVVLGIEITRGVVALHSAGVVHRDLKPENILLPAFGTPRAKIADFGIARSWGKQRSTQTSEWRGTPTYGAPETFTSSTTTDRARVPPLSPEADIYSLGVLLFRMLTGEFVFPVRDEGDTYEVVAAHLHGQPRRARTLNTEVPSDVEHLLVQMVAKNPSDRPTLHRVLEILEQHTSGETRRRPFTAHFEQTLEGEGSSREGAVPPPGARTRFTAAQRRIAAIVMGAAVLLVTAGLFRYGAGATTHVAPPGNSEARANARRFVATSPTVEDVPVAHMESSSSETGGVPAPQPSPARTTAHTAAGASSSNPIATHTSAVTVAVQADGIVLANGGLTRIPGVKVVVIAADMSQYQFADADGMEPGGQLMIPFAMFQPEIPEGAHLRRIDVALGSGTRPQDHISRRLD